MRRRISWLVLATTSTVVVSFVVPLCLLVRTLAEDRAMAAADQEARNVAILVAGLLDARRLGRGRREPGQPRRIRARGAHRRRRRSWAPSDRRRDPEVRRAPDGEAFTVVDDAGGRVLLPVVTAAARRWCAPVSTDDVLRPGVTGPGSASSDWASP